MKGGGGWECGKEAKLNPFVSRVLCPQFNFVIHQVNKCSRIAINFQIARFL